MGRFQPDTTNDGRVRWKVGQLRPGAESEIVYRCTLGAPGTNRMEVVAEGPNELAAFQSAVTVVEALADLKLEVDDPRGPNPVGKKVEYDVWSIAVRRLPKTSMCLLISQMALNL